MTALRKVYIKRFQMCWLYTAGNIAYMMHLSVFSYFIIFNALLVSAAAVRIRYISTEHPAVTYTNPKYVHYANLTARRHSRQDPFYYVDFHVHFAVSIGNNVSVHFYFFEFLSNEYRRGFVEMHFGFCDLVHKDKFFGSALRQGKFKQPCPFPADEYHCYNMTIPIEQIPRSFPFTKGRIYCNVTIAATERLIASGYIDMEVKDANIIRNRKN